MNFDTQTIASQVDTSTYINNQLGLKGGEGNTAEYYENELAGVSIVGMNVENAKIARQKIVDYCTKIEDHLSQLNTMADSTVAFKDETGSIQRALQNYLGSIQNYCINLTSGLLAFSDKIADAQAQWEAYTDSMSGTINTAASNVSNATDTGKYNQVYDNL